MSLCLVVVFKLYRSELNPDFNHLWQRLKQGCLHYMNDIWYDKVLVGKDPLERFMKYLSTKINLSKSYTNHCVRHTVMDTWDLHGFGACHVQGVSGKPDMQLQCELKS